MIFVINNISHIVTLQGNLSENFACHTIELVNELYHCNTQETSLLIENYRVTDVIFSPLQACLQVQEKNLKDSDTKVAEIEYLLNGSESPLELQVRQSLYSYQDDSDYCNIAPYVIRFLRKGRHEDSETGTQNFSRKDFNQLREIADKVPWVNRLKNKWVQEGCRFLKDLVQEAQKDNRLLQHCGKIQRTAGDGCAFNISESQRRNTKSIKERVGH